MLPPENSQRRTGAHPVGAFKAALLATSLPYKSLDRLGGGALVVDRPLGDLEPEALGDQSLNASMS